MTARLLDGAALARTLQAELLGRVEALAERGVRPGLGVLLVGDDPASATYVAAKTGACEATGVRHETARLSATAGTEQVLAQIRSYNERADIHGILVQLPLPPGVDAARALETLDPAKDVDGFHPTNVGLLVQKRPRFVACTPAGILELLRRNGVELSGRRAVVLGRSDIVGKPMALLLLHADATVTLAHSRTRELAQLTREADLLVVAAGRPGLVRAEHVKPGAVVVDVGMNWIDDPALARELLSPERLRRFETRGRALVGDVHEPSVRERAGALTPVPGGVGPLTIAFLVTNTVAAAERLAQV